MNFVRSLRPFGTLRLLPLILVVACQGQVEHGSLRARSTDAAWFARTVQELSEQGGYFDTDNLISNERSYLHVLGRLREMRVSGGAYLGVGPAQNFSYIAHVRPEIAFILDIRRDNLLQHLFFKALFEMSADRLEYLSLLVGRDDSRVVPEERAGLSLEQLVEYLDSAPGREDLDQVADSVRMLVAGYGVPLTDADLNVVNRIHRQFLTMGLNLRFSSHGRAPRPYYPSFRDLLLETDLSGRLGNYLGSEEDFQFLKNLERRNLVIPVVGDFAGPHALRSIGALIDDLGLTVSAFYTSNVEFYLMRNGIFDRFAENVSHLPAGENSVMIRSYFGGGFRAPHPQAVPGYYSTQLIQSLRDFQQQETLGGYLSYQDLITRHVTEPSESRTTTVR